MLDCKIKNTPLTIRRMGRDECQFTTGSTGFVKQVIRFNSLTEQVCQLENSDLKTTTLKVF